MTRERLVLVVYGTLALSLWWLLRHSQTIAGWMLGLLLMVLALSADYVITEAPEWLSRLVKLWKRVTRDAGSSPHGRPRA
jgi:hypothetical protein